MPKNPAAVRWTSAVAVAALVVPALVGCSTLTTMSGPSAERDAESGEITDAGAQSAFSLQIGDCFNDQMTSEAADVPAVPCTDAHDNEVSDKFDLPDGEWPGMEAVEASATAGCIERFEAFVGLAYDASALEVFPITPTEQTWNQIGDREIVCAVWDPAGLVTGSLRGAAR